MKTKLTTLAICLSAGILSPVQAADFHKNYISIIGSTDIEPYARAVNERFLKSGRYQKPLLQASGTGGALKLFCEGLGPESPDIALAVRTMRPKEKEECKKNGVEAIEMEIGYDAVILAQSKKAEPLALTRKEARLGAAQWLVDKDGKLAPNPNKTWKDVNPSLPATKIDIHGPTSTSGVYDAFVELVSGMECKSKPWVPDAKTPPNADTLRKCRTLRDPGVYVTDPIDSSTAVAQLSASPDELGIVDFKTLNDNSAKIRAVPIDGVEPTHENIASQTYPGAQRFYIFVKTGNLGVIPGLKEYVAEFAGENALSEKGYLKPLGLVSLLPEQRAALRERLKSYGINASSTLTAGAAPAKGKAGGKAKGKKK